MSSVEIRLKPGVAEEFRRRGERIGQVAQIEANHQVNETLAAYTQSTSFTMNLGRTHVIALGHLARENDAWVYQSKDLTSPALRGLERRGLVVHRDATEIEDDNPPPFGKNVPRWNLTTAGKLMVALLVEAGLLSPALHSTELPPPPPGWVDPRPKVELS